MKDYEVNYIDLKTGETIAYRKAGQGDETILLIHGNMSSSVHYQVLMEELEKQYTVYAMDMVGFGDSTYNRQINSLHDFSQDVSAFIEALNLKDLYIMGWSTGGGVVLETACDIPERIKKVFLQSSVGIQGYPMFKKDENNQPILTERIFKREDIEKDPVQVVPALQAYEANNKDYFKFVWNLTIYNKKQPDEKDYDKYLDAILKQRNLVDVDVALTNFNMTNDPNGVNNGTGRISMVKAPVVILHGEDDMVVPKDFALLTKSYFGDQAELVMIEDAGHSLFTDKFDTFYQEFVKRLN